MRARLKGEVVYFYSYDLGAQVKLDGVQSVLGAAPGIPTVTITRAAPKYVALPRPILVKLRPFTLDTNIGPVTFDVTAKIFDIGAVSFSLRTPLAVGELGEVSRYGTLRVRIGKRETTLQSLTDDLFATIEENVRPHLLETYGVKVEPETYTVFCFTDAGAPVDELLEDRPQLLAALLSDEPSADRLSGEEVRDNLRYWFRYYHDDLVIIDWDGAIVVEPAGRYEDVLFVIEAANVQLLELRTYDAYLDRILGRAYGDLDRLFKKKDLFFSPQRVQKELSEAAIDLTRVTDEIDNIGKLFGDYYLAKIYVALTERFHLQEWETAVEKKMATLSELYTIATQEVQSRRSLVLEVMIVLLFVLDLILLFILSAPP